MTKAFGGVLNALATPFVGDDAAIDHARLDRLVDDVIAGGVHGIIPCGSTGEFNSMSSVERKDVVEKVVERVAGRVPVIPHTGALTAREAIDLSKHAEQAGADGIMLVAPFYEPLNVNEAKHYYRTVAEAVSLDVIIYNLPVATGLNLQPHDVADLAQQVPNIKYVKDTSGDFSQATRLIHDYADAITTFVGLDTLFFASAVEGAAGTIVGSANLIPRQLVEVWNTAKEGDLVAARKTWDNVYPLMQFLTEVGYVTGVKGAMRLLNDDIGDPRRPYEVLAGDKRDELAAILSKL